MITPLSKVLPVNIGLICAKYLLYRGKETIHSETESIIY